MVNRACRIGSLIACVGLASGVRAQVAPDSSVQVPWHADSGPIAIKSGEARTVYETTVFVPRAAWLRLRFDAVELPGAIEEGRGPRPTSTGMRCRSSSSPPPARARAA
jgi:hypothetical protein